METDSKVVSHLGDAGTIQAQSTEQLRSRSAVRHYWTAAARLANMQQYATVYVVWDGIPWESRLV
jgi:hypothetical protein